jgi:predicted DNA-binding transcriptional regulator AlpA
MTAGQSRNSEARERRHRTQPRRGLSLVESAVYLGIAPAKFETLFDQGRLPKPRLIDGTQAWDIDELDEAFERFPRIAAPAVVRPPKPWQYDQLALVKR